LGFTEREFYAFSLKGWLAAIAGLTEKYGGADAEPMTMDELDALMERYPD